MSWDTNQEPKSSRTYLVTTFILWRSHRALREFFSEVKSMEKLFNDIMGPLYWKGPQINDRISNFIVACLPSSNEDLIKTFIRHRIFFLNEIFKAQVETYFEQKVYERKLIRISKR